MKYAKIWATILAIIGAIVAFIFGRRSRILDNGGRANTIRNGIDDSASRASTVTVGIVDAEKSVDNIASRVDNASKGIGDAIGIIQRIRDRGAKKTDDASG